MPVALADRPLDDRARIAAAILTSLAAAEARATPFPNWRLRSLLPEATARGVAGLPFAPHGLGGVSGRRELHNPGRRYFAGEVLAEHRLARGVVAALQSIAVVGALAALTGAVLAGAYLRVRA
jgi:hypothetical protein